MGRVLTQKYTIDVGSSTIVRGICYWNGRIYYISGNMINSISFTSSGGFGSVGSIVSSPVWINLSNGRIATDGTYLYVITSYSSATYLRAYNLVTLEPVGNSSANFYRSGDVGAIYCGTDGFIYAGNYQYLEAFTFNGSVFSRVGSTLLNISTASICMASGILYVTCEASQASETLRGTFGGTNFSLSSYDISDTWCSSIVADSNYAYLLDHNNKVWVLNRTTMAVVTSLDTGTGTGRVICLDGTYIYIFADTGIRVLTLVGSTLTVVSNIASITDAAYHKMCFADDHLIVADSDDLYALRMDLTAQFTVNSQSGKVGDTFTFTAI